MPAGTITALRVQERDSQRVNVFIDGAFVLGVSLTTIARERLYVGQVLSADALVRLEQTESADRALHAAMRAVEARPRSYAELRTRLRGKGFAPEAIDSALARLRDLGLADDAAFARFWVENRLTCRPRGAGALRAELRAKGVSPEIIAATVDDEELIGDESARAETLARAALRKYAGAQDYAQFARRLGGYLQRRGFGPETVRPLLAQLWAETGGAEASDDPLENEQDDA